VAYFKALIDYFPGRTERKLRKSLRITVLISDIRNFISRIENRSANDSTPIFIPHHSLLNSNFLCLRREWWTPLRLKPYTKGILGFVPVHTFQAWVKGRRIRNCGISTTRLFRVPRQKYIPV
jgi:hypothetical protein